MLTASSVELLYWPTPYATPSPTTTITPGPSLVTSVGPDGYTYTSPSVYVIYHSLQAWNDLSGGQAGSTYDTLTVAYDPTELSTLYGCSQTVLSTSALNFQDFNMPPRWSVLSQHQGCDTCGQVYQFPGPPHPGDELVSNYANMTYAYNAMVNGVTSWRLQPDFVLPPSLNDQDPHWQGCNGFTWGVFDPPRTLVAAPAMVAPPSAPPPSTTPASEPPSTVDNAKPVSLPADPSPTQTPAPSVGKQSSSSDPKIDSPVPPALDPSQDSSADRPNPPSNAKLNSPVDPESDPSQDSAAGKQSSSSDSKLNSPANPASNLSQDPAVNKENPSSNTRPNDPASPETPDSISSQDLSKTADNVYPAAAQVAAVGHTIAAHPSGGISIDGSHLSIGSSDTTTNGIRIAQNSAGIIIGGNAIQIPSATATSPFASLNGQGIAKASGGGIIVGGSTISPGTEASIGNIQVSVGDGRVSVIPTTLPYVAIGPAASPPTVSNSPAGLDPNGNAASDGDNSDKSASGPNGPALGIVAAGQTWTPLNHGTVVANGATISVGGPALTTSGTVLSMNDAGLVTGSSTIAIPGTGPQTKAAAGQTFTPLPNNHILEPGNPTLDTVAPTPPVAGLPSSLRSSALVVVGPSTIIPLSDTSPTPTTPKPIIITAAGETFTPVGSNAAAVVVVAHDDDGSATTFTTLSIGGAALTSNGTVVSMASGGLVVAGASTTVPVPSSSAGGTVNTSLGLGSVIMSGFGNGSSRAPEVFEGAAAAGKMYGLGVGLDMWLAFVGWWCLGLGGRWV